MCPATVKVILCVEDERDLLQDIAEELEEAGYQAVMAVNGELALEAMENQRPDLILCDISMPGMNGYELLEAVQNIGSDYADIPFVFLTAFSDPHQVVKGKQSGADDYLVKPIDYDLLLATVDARLRQVDRIRASFKPAVNALIRRHHLTQREAHISILLVEGMQVDGIASHLQIARSTVVSHLRHIFSKTNTSRQAELVALLLKPAPDTTNES